MNGWQQLNRIDLEILDGISREWDVERKRMAHDEYLLQGNAAAGRSASARARLVALVVGAGLLAAVLIGLAMAAASNSGSTLVFLGA